MWSSKTKVIERRKEIINGQEVWVKVMEPHHANGSEAGVQRTIFTKPKANFNPAVQMSAVKSRDRNRWREINTGKRSTVPIVGNKRPG